MKMQKKTFLDRKENAHIKKVKPVCVKWDIVLDTRAYCRAITGVSVFLFVLEAAGLRKTRFF